VKPRTVERFEMVGIIIGVAMATAWAALVLVGLAVGLLVILARCL